MGQRSLSHGIITHLTMLESVPVHLYCDSTDSLYIYVHYCIPNMEIKNKILYIKPYTVLFYNTGT